MTLIRPSPFPPSPVVTNSLNDTWVPFTYNAFTTHTYVGPNGTHPAYFHDPAWAPTPVARFLRLQGTMTDPLTPGGYTFVVIVGVDNSSGPPVGTLLGRSTDLLSGGTFDITVDTGSFTQLEIGFRLPANSTGYEGTYSLVGTAKWYATQPLLATSLDGCVCVPCGQILGEPNLPADITGGGSGSTVYWTCWQYFGSVTGPTSSLIARHQIDGGNTAGTYYAWRLFANDFDGNGNLLNPTDPANPRYYYGMTRAQQLALVNISVVVSYDVLYLDQAGLADGVVGGVTQMGRGAVVTDNPFGGAGPAPVPLSATHFTPQLGPYLGGFVHVAGHLRVILPIRANAFNTETMAFDAYGTSGNCNFGDRAAIAQSTFRTSIPLIPQYDSNNNRVGGLYTPTLNTSLVSRVRPQHHGVGVVGGIPHAA